MREPVKITWRIPCLALGLLVLAGCQADPSIALLERDNRLKEDEIYRLRWRIQDLEQNLHATAPLAQPAEPSSQGAGAAEQELRAPAPAPSEPNTPAPPSVTVPELPESQVPGRFRNPGGEAPPSQNPSPSPGGEAPRYQNPSPLPGSQIPRNENPSSPPAGHSSGWNHAGGAADSANVAQIALSQIMTGGYARDARSADDGVMVVIDPRDIAGNVVAAPADVSIVVLDPALAGEASRVARWDFTAAEIAAKIHAGPDPGIHLELPWPAAPPQHGKLALVVRYTTRDGRKLQAHQTISVAVAEALSADRLPMEERPLQEPAAQQPGGWRYAAGAAREADDPGLRIASRPDAPAPDRPTWSPDRP